MLQRRRGSEGPIVQPMRTPNKVSMPLDGAVRPAEVSISQNIILALTCRPTKLAESGEGA